MAEKKWTDKLRQKMEGYEQMPPSGLWEAIEAGLPVRQAAFPWMWALAGVAAVALAAVLIWHPAESPVTGPALAEADRIEIVDIPDEGAVDAVEAADAVAPVSDMLAQAPAVKRVARPAPVNPMTEETVVPAIDEQETMLPDANEQEAAEPETGEPEVIVPETGKTEVNTPEVKVPETVMPETNVLIPDAPVSRTKSAPRLTASLLAGGLPGSATSYSSGYGIAANAAPRSARMAMAPLLSRNKPSESESHYSVAMRVGAMFNLSFSEHWGIETGLQLTNLQNQTKSVTGSVTTIKDKTIAYVGIPVMAVWTPLRFDRFSLYASAGPMFEYGFRSLNKDETYIGSELEGAETYNAAESDAIFSVGMNIGAQWMVSEAGALFIQPGVSWHLAGAGNTETFYTQHPFAFGHTAGFRFGF